MNRQERVTQRRDRERKGEGAWGRERVYIHLYQFENGLMY